MIIAQDRSLIKSELSSGYFYEHSVFGVPLPEQSDNLKEDLIYILVASYFMAKTALKGFAIFGIPFWVTTIGAISIFS